MNPFDPITVPLTGTALIEASAGTGKTHTITTLFVRLVVESQLPIDSILVVTFTRAATAELKHRIRRRLRETMTAIEGGEVADEVLQRFVDSRPPNERRADARRVREALRDFDRAAISTIHGFCQRVLHDNAFESGVAFDAELLTDEREIVREVVEDFWAKYTFDAPAIVLGRLADRAFEPEKLLTLAYRALATPDAPIQPAEAPSPADLESVFERWRQALQVLRSRWQTVGSDLPNLLDGIAGLERTLYRRDTVARWPAALAQALTVERPFVSERFGHFGRLTVEHIARCTRGRAVEPHPFFVACSHLHAIEAELLPALDDAIVRLQIELVGAVREELPRRKRARNVFSWTDLLARVDAAVAMGGSLHDRMRATFRAALIDEFQDTDPVQYRIFRRLWGSSEQPLFLIGDPKQAIYAFRGADVFSYFTAARDARHVHTLTENWRADRDLVGAVNLLFSGVRAPFVLPQIDFSPVRAPDSATNRLAGPPDECVPLQILFLRRNEQQGLRPGVPIAKSDALRILRLAVAGEVRRTLDSGLTIDGKPVRPADIAVLTRTNAQAREVQDELRRLAIPSVLHTDASVFDSDEAEELERLLRAIIEPADASVVRAALATSFIGLDATTIHGLQEDDATWDTWLERFRDWQECWRERGVISMLQRLLEDADVSQRVLVRPDGERRMTNLLHLCELVHTAASRRHLGPLATLYWLVSVRRDEALRRQELGESAQIRLESDEHAVSLVTIHKSKGLQYPIVLCPFAWDGSLLFSAESEWPRYHDPESMELVLDIGSAMRERARKIAEREVMAENLRILYVAMTRARHRVTLVWGAFHRAGTSALAYLLHQDPTVVSEDTVAEVAKRFKDISASDDRLVADLLQLQTKSSGLVRVSDVTTGATRPWISSRHPENELSWRTAARELTTTWRLSSFSRIAAAAGGGLADEHEARDRDDSQDSDPAAPSVDRHRVPLADFPAGPRTGNCLHEILEHGSLAELERARVDHALSAHGFSPSVWGAAVHQSLSAALATPLASGICLARIDEARCRRELEFTIAVATERNVVPFSAVDLAQILAEHGSPVARRYADRAAGLAFPELAGYLRGFVDLVFWHDERAYIVDYKSNLLGPTFDDYRTDRLTTAMLEHDYVLQYHIYAAAMHLHLRSRYRGYRYDRHFGGVFYLFLRGMDPSSDRCGVFWDRPSEALLDALTMVFGVKEKLS